MKNCFKRALTFLMTAGMLLTVTACEDRTGPYVSRPQDSMLIYHKEDGAYLTNTDGAAFTAAGKEGGLINYAIVPLASGSVYYIEDGTLYYKSYLEPAYKMTDGIEAVFYSLGSVFALTQKGELLRTDDQTGYEVVLKDVGSQGFCECANTVYVVSGTTLYRLFFGGAPEKMQTYEKAPVFLSGNSEEIFFAADGAVWKCGHKAVSPRCISGKETVAPVVPERRVSYAEKLFWQDESGEVYAYEVKSGKAEKIGLKLAYVPFGEAYRQAKLLPEGISDTEAMVFEADEGFFAYLFDQNKVVSLSDCYWAYAEKDCLYGFSEEGLVIFDGKEENLVDGLALHNAVTTPNGYYFMTYNEDMTKGTLRALHDGEAEVISEDIPFSCTPHAVYKYGGISYFTDEAIYIMDEETRVSEVFAECEGVVDFVPVSGGAYTLFETGLLDVMIYGEKLSETVSEDVTGIDWQVYMPERLFIYPNW